MANALNKVKTSGVEDDAISLAKMAPGTDGQVLTYDASGNPVAVGPGTDGQVLTSTGAGSPPAFETLPTSGAALTGSTNNQITTVTGANAIQGEANLTFDGSKLDVTSPSTAANDSEPIAVFTTQGHCQLRLNGDANQWSVMALDGGGSASGDFIIYDKNNSAEKLRVQGDGHVKINDGNLVIGTSGHGIDFSATSDAGGMSNELLADYEEGRWTPRLVYYNAGSGGWNNACTYTDSPDLTNAGVYTKIGRLVYFSYYTTLFNIDTGAGYLAGIDGLPYTCANVQYYVVNTAHATAFTTSAVNGYVSPNSNLMVFTKIDSQHAAVWSTNDSYIMLSGFYQV